MSICVMDPGGPGGVVSPSSPSFSNSSKLVLLIDKVLENAQTSGMLDLSSRNLKTFPKSGGKYRLKDTRVAGKTNYITFSLNYGLLVMRHMFKLKYVTTFSHRSYFLYRQIT